MQLTLYYHNDFALSLWTLPVNNYCSSFLTFCRAWTREEMAFGKERYEFFTRMNEENAQILKDKGNEKFKLGIYDEAARLYTEAINCVPQGTDASKAGKLGRW